MKIRMRKFIANDVCDFAKRWTIVWGKDENGNETIKSSSQIQTKYLAGCGGEIKLVGQSLSGEPINVCEKHMSDWHFVSLVKYYPRGQSPSGKIPSSVYRTALPEQIKQFSPHQSFSGESFDWKSNRPKVIENTINSTLVDDLDKDDQDKLNDEINKLINKLLEECK